MTHDPFAVFKQNDAPVRWMLSGLDPTPEEEWQRMRAFLNLSDFEMGAMLHTVEVLFRRGHELVAGTYDYLLATPETAAILGWEAGADPVHLSERRRFFTVWLARLLGLDFSTDLARYLFHAGKLHAAHGPRKAHVPPVYVTGSIALVNAAFARFLSEELPGDPKTPAALAGWNKLLSLHSHMMQLGYHAAAAIDRGEVAVQFSLFGRMRTLTGRHELAMHVNEGSSAQTALTKFFNYFPSIREEVFDVHWQPAERDDARGTPWFTVKRDYVVKPQWRVLHNGRDLAYYGGLQTTLHPQDEVHIFPPGR